VDVLSESYSRDLIDLAEFERRIESVEAAGSVDELRRILGDLAVEEAGRAIDAVRVPSETIPAHSVTVGILGGGAKTGAWMPARTNWALGLLGGCEVDFCEAYLGSGVTEVRVLATLGGVDVWVPPDVRVECTGIGILGGVDHLGSAPAEFDPEAPVLRIIAIGILGGVGVRVRYPGETTSDAKRRAKIERKARKRIGKGR